MSSSIFFVYMVFFLDLPYASHSATSNFVAVCFRFVQTTLFFLSFPLLHNLSQTFVNDYKLYSF